TSVLAENAVGARTQRSERDRRLVGASRDLERTGTPPAGDLDFPKDWQERVKNRTTLVPLTEKEKAILKALKPPVTARFKGEPFEDAIKYLSEQLKQPILLDRVALEEAQVNYETPISLETPATGLAARTVLRRILSDFGLQYVIKDQSIEVTSALKAKSLMVVRSYFIGDLVNNPALAIFFGQPWPAA